MPAFDPLTYRYASRRNVVYAQNAVACTSVPLGAQIGLDVMKSGGSAVDAAVAMAAAMPLLEPTGNGLGSNCFALVWIERDKRNIFYLHVLSFQIAYLLLYHLSHSF